jgi:hypothetical protein
MGSLGEVATAGGSTKGAARVVEGAFDAKLPGEAGPPQSATEGAAAIKEGAVVHVGQYRWVICALLFFATTIN